MPIRFLDEPQEQKSSIRFLDEPKASSIRFLDETPGALEQARQLAAAAQPVSAQAAPDFRTIQRSPARQSRMDYLSRKRQEEESAKSLADADEQFLGQMQSKVEGFSPYHAIQKGAETAAGQGIALGGEGGIGLAAGAGMAVLNTAGGVFAPVMAGTREIEQQAAAGASALGGDRETASKQLMGTVGLYPDLNEDNTWTKAAVKRMGGNPDSIATEFISQIEFMAREDPGNAALMVAGLGEGGANLYAARLARLGRPLPPGLERNLPETRATYDRVKTELEAKGKAPKPVEAKQQEQPEPAVELPEKSPEDALIEKLEQPEQMLPEPMPPLEPSNLPAPDVDASLSTAVEPGGIDIRQMAIDRTPPRTDLAPEDVSALEQAYRLAQVRRGMPPADAGLSTAVEPGGIDVVAMGRKPAPPVEAPPAAAPVEAPAPKPAKRKAAFRYSDPIKADIMDNGGIRHYAKDPSSGKIPEYEENKRLIGMMREGGAPLDIHHARLQSEGKIPPEWSADDLREYLLVRSPRNMSEAKWAKAKEQQQLQWEKTGSQKVLADNLSPGDEFTIRGEKFRVIEETDTALHIKDGLEYWIPYEGSKAERTLRVDKGSVKSPATSSSPPVAAPTSPATEVPTIESPAIQARIKRVHAQFIKQFPNADPAEAMSRLLLAAAKALEKYDPTKGAKPETFVEAAMRNALADIIKKGKTGKAKVLSQAARILSEDEAEAGGRGGVTDAALAEAAGGGDPAAMAAAKEEAALAISKLPNAKQRRVMEEYQRFLEDETGSVPHPADNLDLQKELDLSPQGIRNQIASAQAKLSELRRNAEKAEKTASLKAKPADPLEARAQELSKKLKDSAKRKRKGALGAADTDLADQTELAAIRALQQAKEMKGAASAAAIENRKSMGPGAASIEDKLQDFGERQFAKKVTDDPTVPSYVKENISRYYEKMPNEVTQEHAERIIYERGFDEVERLILSDDPALPGRVKTPLGYALSQKLGYASEAAKQAGDTTTANILSERQAAIYDAQAQRSTQTAQDLQAMHRLWNHLTPEGKAFSYRRRAKTAWAEHSKNNEPHVVETVEAANSVPDAASINRGVRSEASKALAKARRINRGPLPKEVEQSVQRLTENPRSLWDRYRKGAADRLASKLERVVAGSKGSKRAALDEFTQRLAKALAPKVKPGKVESTRISPMDAIRESLVNREKYEQTWKDAIKAAKENIKERFKGDPESEATALDALETLSEIERVYSNETLGAAVRDRMATLGERVADMASRSDPENLDLANRIARSVANEIGAAREPGLKPEAIESLTNDLRDAVLRMVNEHRIARLKALTSRGNPVAAAAKSKTDLVIEAANRGELTQERFYNIVADKLGLPKWSPEIAAEIRRLAALEQSAPEGMPKTEAMHRLNAYISENVGHKLSEVWLANLYPSVLSGIRSQEANFVDTGLNVLAEMMVSGRTMTGHSAALDTIRTGAALGARRAMRVVKTGITPFFGKYQTPRLLETARWGEKGGLASVTPSGPVGRAVWSMLRPVLESPVGKINSAQKYVPRVMAAADTFWYSIAQRWNIHAKLYEMARKQGLAGKEASRWIAQQLESGTELMDSAKAQTTKEGYKPNGNDWHLRVTEIMDQGRNPSFKSAVELADDNASRATYNHKPEGILGKISDSLEAFKIKHPAFALAVMFTRIPANVFNRYLNYTPWGYVRAFKGFDGIKPTKGEALVFSTKATLGTAITATAAVLEAKGLLEVSGSGPDDPNKRKQLMGTGWRPYHLKIPGTNTWVNYMLSPPGMMLAIYANGRDAFKRRQDKRGAVEAIKFAITRIGKTAMDQSFLSNTAKLLEAISSGSVSAMTRFVASSTVSSVIPFKGALTDLQNLMFDDKRYTASTLSGAILSETPFAKMLGRPDLNAMGQPIRLDPIRTFKVNPVDPAWRFVVDNEAWIPVPSKSETMIGDRYITPEEYYKMIEVGGPIIRRHILQGMDGWAKGGKNREQIQEHIRQYSNRVWQHQRAKIAIETGAMRKPPVRTESKPVPYDD